MPKQFQAHSRHVGHRPSRHDRVGHDRVGHAQGAFRRLTLFPAPPGYFEASFGSAGRGLVPLPVIAGGDTALVANALLWSLAAVCACVIVLWSGALGAGLSIPVPVPVPTLPIEAVAATPGLQRPGDVLRRVAAAFPRAGSVVLARFPPGSPDDGSWTLVEVDGKSLRSRADRKGVEAALAAAGVRLDEADRVYVVPNEGARLAPEGPGGAGASPVLPGRTGVDRIVVQRAVPFSVVDGGFPTGLHAAASTVGEALQAVGIDIYAADVVRPALDTPFAPGIKVAILRALPVSIVAPDVQVETRTRAGTVGDLLAEHNVELGPLDRVVPAPEEAVPAWGTVRIVRVRQETETELQVLPFRTRLQVQPGLAPGARRRLQVGVEGLLVRTFTVTYEDGDAGDRVLDDEVRQREPVDEVIGVGPAEAPVVHSGASGAPAGAPPIVSIAAPDAGSEGARRALSMVATAYDPGPISTGKSPGHPAYGITASGRRAGYGVVAVDPRVIPLGTRLFIPGYGAAIAGDTGGAIKGNRIDLGFATYGEAIRYGRQTVTVYVLE